MTRKEFEALLYDRFGVSADYPFEGDFESGVFRHENGKWFALAMNISAKKLGIDSDMTTQVVNFKCSPEIIESSVGEEVGVYTAYHMNKTHWLTVCLEECSPDNVEWLLGISYQLTLGKGKTRK